jgi:alpha-glucosidase
VVYEVYVRSLQDSNGDGIGDLPGLTSRLDDLKALGVDALWLMPIMPTAFADSGYDVSDYTAVNADYGTLADFDALVAGAHQRGMRVMIDLVLNHTSDQHSWFKESKKDKTNAKADWYVWSDTPNRPDIGCGTFSSQFGDSAWTLAPERNQYFYHRFYAGQPDLNYRNPEVVKATLDAAKFWLDRGVDGFRCDVIGLLFESATGCDMIPETQDYIRQLRALLDSFPDRAMVAESTNYSSAAAYFGNGKDMFHMAFNFGYGYFWGLPFSGTNAQPVADKFITSQTMNPAGSQDALVIGSHDVPRASVQAHEIESRWRRAAFVQMTMPGTPFVYYGEELAMRPGKKAVVDGRDYQRTPMLWTKDPGHGFTTGTPWIPFGDAADTTSVDVESADPASNYSFYKKLLAVRRGRAAFGTGALAFVQSDDPTVLMYTRASADETYVMVVSMDETDPHTATAAMAGLPGDAQLLFGDATLTRNAASAKVTIPPAGMAIFRVKLPRQSFPWVGAGDEAPRIVVTIGGFLPDPHGGPERPAPREAVVLVEGGLGERAVLGERMDNRRAVAERRATAIVDASLARAGGALDRNGVDVTPWHGAAFGARSRPADLRRETVEVVTKIAVRFALGPAQPTEIAAHFHVDHEEASIDHDLAIVVRARPHAEVLESLDEIRPIRSRQRHRSVRVDGRAAPFQVSTHDVPPFRRTSGENVDVQPFVGVAVVAPSVLAEARGERAVSARRRRRGGAPAREQQRAPRRQPRPRHSPHCRRTIRPARFVPTPLRRSGRHLAQIGHWSVPRLRKCRSPRSERSLLRRTRE